MECCDSVSSNGASGPHTQQPPGLCRPLAPSPLLLAREQAIHRSTATLSMQGGQVGRAEEERLARRHEEKVREKQVNECSTREMLKDAAEREKADEEEECDDVERPIGEILYQPDGSAYVMESKLTSGVPSSLLGAPCSIVRTCYISSSHSPTPQIFRVFQLHNPDDSDSLALVTCQSKDSAPDMAGSLETGVTCSGLTKPILMCFLCRLSFGCTRSFRAHACRQHNTTFNDEEKHLLSLKYTSAILQPAGPANRPLLCFLEPKRNCESVVPLNLASLTSGNSTEDTARRKENEDPLTSKPGLPLLPSPPRTSPATSVPSPAKDPSTLGREGTQRGKEDEIRKNGGSSEGGERKLCLEVGSTVDNSAHRISSSSGQEHITEAALSNQSISKPPNSVTIATSFMNNTKTLTNSESECGTSFNCHNPAPASLVVVNPSTVTTTEQLANQDSATATEPNDQLENGSAIAMEPTARLSEDERHAVTHSDLPNNHSHSTSPTLSPNLSQTSQPILEEGHSDTASRGRLVVAGDGGFVAAGDDVQGSSFTFGIQASLVHTRNSCKTLKCPKCNWHYKYQQTLEAHMKEKHAESESEQCPYCSSGQSHPRLARGETYSCGYKPFRCQVCQYSTTTKGNLSIHMQSDKHLNNMQSLQTQSHVHSPASQPNPLTHSHPTLTQPTQASSPSPSKLRGHASWRCEVCDYETNVARNLRIHMTSEKHTHNVLLLQQNLAHMQRQSKHNSTELYRHCQPQSKLPDAITPLSCSETSSQKLFVCILCGRFSCDTLEELSQHLSMQRSLPNSYWRSTTGDTHHCRLCHYATPLRANFQLHCQTDKHVQRYQLAAHLREASSQHGNTEEEEEEWRLRCVAAGSQVQLRCNACDYEASSLEKLKLHTMNSRHETSLRLYKYLQKLDGVESEDVWLHCVLCDFSTQNSLSLVQHSHSLSHQRGEGLLRLQRIQKGLQDEEELGAIFTIRKSPAQENGDKNGVDSPTEVTANQEDRNKHGDRTEKKSEGFIQMEAEQNESSSSPKRPSSGSDESVEPSPCKRPRIQEEMRQCPFCRFRHTDIERLRSHVMNQHAVQPAVRCPLCQDTLHSIALLRTHLTHLHSVTVDCTQKLINTPEMDEQKLTNDPSCEKDTNGQKSNAESKEIDNVGTNEKTHDHKSQENEDLNKEMSTSGESFDEFLPPRIGHDAPGNASKALLENIGFELVMQYNENKEIYQKNVTEPIPNGGDVSDTKEVGLSEDMEKLECESCGKLFSNALILKSHKEQIHHSIFPIKSLEKFAKDYREQYDKLFPLRPATPEASPVSSPSPSPPAIPNSSVQQPQQQQQPASTLSATPATVSMPQVKAPLAQIPLPMELPLFPPLLMPSIPLQALTPQVPVHLPPVEAGLTPDLTQLYQQQLTPAMLQQQSKRPRTRITDDQLRILRQYFDINNSPNEDQIHEMANKSGLPHKVIKHWFRNTLFKERQRNKDSPYNFSNPPITTLEDVKVDSRPPSPEPTRQEIYGRTISQMVTNPPAVTTIPDSTINSLKRKLEEKAGSSSMENDWENNGEEPQRDKRMRTTITPEQLEVLYQKYLLDSNPTRKMLDHISSEVGLKKRVVQVWFQNTRARERKGQFRALGPSQFHRRCPFCRALFKAQTALAAHIRSRHWNEAKNAGYSMAIPNMTQDQEGSQIKSDLFDFANYSQFLNSTDDVDSPACKHIDLSSHQQRLSPKPIKGEGMEDFEMPSVSVYQNPEQSKLNNCNASTNAAHDHTTDEGNDSLEAKHGSIDHMSPSTEREASSESDEKMSSGLVSPAMSFNAKDFDNDLVLDYSENSSLADPASPCPGSSSSQSFDNDRHSQKRYRTQMTNLQVKVLKACFSDYKTPTMLECEALGNDIGLAKRVVQVWFQNARAKEKKAKLSLAKQFGTESTSIDRPKTECTLCSVKYSGCLSIRDHVFSQQHLAKVKEALGGQVERDKEYLSPVSTCQLIVQQEVDHLKKTRLQAQTTASIPGGSSTMTEDFSSIKTGTSDPPVNELTCKPTMTPSSAISAMDDKDVVSTTNSVMTPKTTEQELQFPKENDTESNRIPTDKLDSTPLGNGTRANSSCKSKEKSDSSRPTVCTPSKGREYAMDPSQLQALHAVMKTDQVSLLPSHLLPCLMPGFPPLFSPHIPTPMPGGLLQPMFGMDSMFPYGPVLPQTLMGLSPGSILQQYQQNLQGALMQQRLQLQQKPLVQLPEKPKPSPISARLNAEDTVSSKHDKKQGTPIGTDSSSINSVNAKQPEVDSNFLLSHCIVSKAECRAEGKDSHLYDCLACEVSLTGNAELIKHLEYPQHRQRVAEKLNAKEHASPRLPHISPSSTSQSNPSSEQRSSTTAQSSLGTPSETSIPNLTDSDQPDRRLQSLPLTSALPEASQSSPASPSHHVLLPSNVTSSLTSPAKTCHIKTIDSVDGRCNSNESEEGQDLT
ncbi:hypothetical protein cypCar_00022753 [Cyprinus carpio]|nr:hypothetical protein cypCar_00022753 [Cyprinus carpio]